MASSRSKPACTNGETGVLLHHLGENRREKPDFLGNDALLP
jgi:hypothetical protein